MERSTGFARRNTEAEESRVSCLQRSADLRMRRADLPVRSSRTSTSDYLRTAGVREPPDVDVRRLRTGRSALQSSIEVVAEAEADIQVRASNHPGCDGARTVARECRPSSPIDRVPARDDADLDAMSGADGGVDVE